MDVGHPSDRELFTSECARAAFGYMMARYMIVQFMQKAMRRPDEFA